MQKIAPVRMPARVERPSPTVMTNAGTTVSLRHPIAEAISIGVIANHLAKQCRYAGATVAPYSVAQHSVLVSLIIERRTRSAEAALYGLLHDAHEAYIGDIIAPVRDEILAIASIDVVQMIADRFDPIIHRALGLAWPSPWYRAVADADRTAHVTELRDVLPETVTDRNALPEGLHPWPHRIKPQKWDAAEEAFLVRYTDLTAMAGVENRLGRSGRSA